MVKGLTVKREGREVRIGAVEELIQGDQVPCILEDEVESSPRLFVGKVNDSGLLFIGRLDSSLYPYKDMVEKYVCLSETVRIDEDHDCGSSLMPSSASYDYQRVNINSPDGRIIDYLLRLKGM